MFSNFPAITNYGNFGNLAAAAYPTPLGLNYDSKGFTAFHPGNFASNLPRIPSNWP
jgi:hypothetical protein